MGRLVLAIVAIVAVIGLGGAAYLMFADVPAPVSTIEQVVPSDHLAKN